MAGYTIRSLAQLAAEATGAFVQAVQGTATKLWPNVWRVEGKVLALIGFEMEQRRAWLVRQLFASTAERVWLIRHGFEFGLQPEPANTAMGTATTQASPGTVVPIGLQYARGDGVTFTTTAAVAVIGNDVSLPLEADVAASAGNTPAGTVLTLVNPDDAPAGLGRTCTVGEASDGTGLSGGADEESLESFRARVLYRKRNPPQGGSAPDYVAWVLEAVPTAVAVYVDSFQNDSRSVWVQFTVSDQAQGIPTAGQVAAAQAYIDDPIRRPITARVFVSAPIPVQQDIVIGGLDPDTTDIRASIESELAAAYTDRARPGKPSVDFVFSASWLAEAISRATGEDRHRLLSPASDQVFTAGNLPVLGSIAYID
ncbi:baseplate J/gp47 family protein [Methylobacterium fujisawaense]|uniref:baseplate J/gp47 family protein n=1 Tax=Methylobacterium fujisawaense TaxID=107400 RepID=UPI0031F51458